MKQSKGFTLVELLVVIAIIGLLSTLAVVSLNSARSKARDARRVSDIRQIQTALELFYLDEGSYPVEATAIELGQANSATLSTAGFTDGGSASGTIFMGNVPPNFTSPSTVGYNYISSDGSDYAIQFELEGTAGTLSGTLIASSTGIE